MAKQAKSVVSFIWLPATFALLGAAVAAVLTLYVLIPNVNSAQRTTVANQEASALAAVFDRRIRQLTAQAEVLGSSTKLTRLLDQKDEVSIRVEERDLGRTIRHAIRVKLFVVGTAEVDRGSNPPFSFASKVMVNKVEEGRQVLPEAARFQDRWLIQLAAPIRTAESTPLLGTLFIYFSIDALTADLSDDEKQKGRLVITQTYQNAEPQEILGLGAASSEVVVTRQLLIPSWQLSYSPGANVTVPAASVVLFLLPVIVALILALMGAAATVFHLNKVVQADVGILLGRSSDDEAEFGLMPFEQLFEYFGHMQGTGPPQEETPEEETPEPIAKLRKITTVNPKASVVVDIEMVDEEEEEEEEGEAAATTGADDLATLCAAENVDPDQVALAFRAYDIRGIANETLTPGIAHRIGQAVGSELTELGESAVTVGQDGRESSPSITENLIEGIRAAGVGVIDIGQVPTPVLYFATRTLDHHSGVMVSGSHNSAEYNGIKLVFNERTLTQEDIDQLYNRFAEGNFAEGEGDYRQEDIVEDYMDCISDDVVIAQPLKVVIDCGNGVGGIVAPDLLANLGCEVVPLHCDVDGTFPNHDPDPTIEDNLEDLKLMIESEGADLGIAFDGDADRLIAISNQGNTIWPDRLLMLFAKDVVSRNPGSDVIYDVKCSRHLNSVISSFGGRPIICRSGHSYMKAKLEETDALLGGELSGHICFKERWFGFDDGLYAAARLLEIVASQTMGIDELFYQFPDSYCTPEIRVPIDDQLKFTFMEHLSAQGNFDDGSITTIDGIRVDYADGWGLVRASNTAPELTLRFEADDEESLDRIIDLFKDEMASVDQSLELDF